MYLVTRNIDLIRKNTIILSGAGLNLMILYGMVASLQKKINSCNNVILNIKDIDKKKKNKNKNKDKNKIKNDETLNSYRSFFICYIVLLCE